MYSSYTCLLEQSDAMEMGKIWWSLLIKEVFQIGNSKYTPIKGQLQTELGHWYGLVYQESFTGS
jgi:hypothetical protein